MTSRFPSLVCAAALLVMAAGCTEELQHGLTESDANQISVVLLENGIAARKHADEGGGTETKTYKIIVPRQDYAHASRLLSENSLPRLDPGGFERITASVGMIPTAVQERAMMLQAIGGEVAKTLHKVPGVLEVQAIVNIPQNNDLTQPDKKPKPTASVLIKFRQSTDGKFPLSEEQVKRFVANAVGEEMLPEAVAVIMTPAISPAAEANPEGRMVSVIGLTMTAASAAQFRLWVAAMAAIVLLLAAFTTYNFMRGPASSGRQRARARPPEA
jgi:type III secretion protein J